MENNKKIGLPSSKPPVSISRKKKLTSDMKELYLRRKAHRESLALENEDIKDANRRYYGNPQSMDIRLDNLSTLADKYGVENITTHKKGRSYYRPETKTISINEGQYITSDVELTRRSHRRRHNWEGTALKRGMNKDVVEYYTPDWVWSKLKQFIPNDKVIWEPFRKDTVESCRSADCLRELGYNVVNPLCDFFENDYGDIVVSNPCFKDKRKVVEKLFQMNKPFMLLLPAFIISTKYFVKWFKNIKDTQLIVMSDRIDYIREDKKRSRCAFHTMVMCWKLNLKERIIFL